MASSKVAQSIKNQLDLISEALDASADGIDMWRAVRAPDNSIEDFTLIMINKAGATLAGHPQESLIGKKLTEIIEPVAAKNLHLLFEKAIRKSHTVKEIVPSEGSDGVLGVFENTVVPFAKDLVFATYRDVSEAEREHNRLVWLSEHDYLTGMPNRAALESRLEGSIASAQESGALLGFAFIDIDHFKNVNDTFGHDVGDAVLVSFVKRIQNSLPDSAFVARISGDEFAVLLDGIVSESRLNELMDEVFSAMKRPFRKSNQEIPVSCSAGCVITDGSEKLEEIVRVADKAMYRAKHEGRNRYLVEEIYRAT